jgi:sortase B
MFTTLHKFEDTEFFDSHPYFYIYTSDRKLTYQVISAFKYDDRHIMNSFNFADTAVLQEFQEYIQNPNSALKNVRSDLDVDITTSSKIVVLSTCITNQKSSRFLVCGVLTKDEKTN